MDRWFTWMPFNCNNDVSLCLGANSTDCDPPPCLQCPDQRILSTVSLELLLPWVNLTLLTKRAMYFTPNHSPAYDTSILIRCTYCLPSYCSREQGSATAKAQDQPVQLVCACSSAPNCRALFSARLHPLDQL
jgi:hypothetical protein